MLSEAKHLGKERGVATESGPHTRPWPDPSLTLRMTEWRISRTRSIGTLWVRGRPVLWICGLASLGGLAKDGQDGDQNLGGGFDFAGEVPEQETYGLFVDVVLGAGERAQRRVEGGGERGVRAGR